MPSQLSALLVQDRVVSFRQMDAAVRMQQDDGGDISTCLLELDAIDEGILLYYASKQLRIPAIEPDALSSIDREIATLWGRERAEACRAIAYGVRDGNVQVAVVEPLPTEVVTAFQSAHQLGIDQRVALELRVAQACQAAYGLPMNDRLTELAERFPSAIGVARTGESRIQPDPDDSSSNRPTSTIAPANPGHEPALDSELAGLTWSMPQWSAFVTTSTDRDAMLLATLGFIGKFFTRRMVLVLAPGTVRGFASQMDGESRRPIARFERSFEDGSPLQRLYEGHSYFLGALSDSGLAALYEHLGCEAPADVLVMPICVGSRAALALVGDAGSRNVNPKVLPILSLVARRLGAGLERLVREMKLRRSASLPSVGAEAPDHLSTGRASQPTDVQRVVDAEANRLLEQVDSPDHALRAGMQRFTSPDWQLPEDFEAPWPDLARRSPTRTDAGETPQHTAMLTPTGEARLQPDDELDGVEAAAASVSPGVASPAVTRDEPGTVVTTREMPSEPSTGAHASAGRSGQPMPSGTTGSLLPVSVTSPLPAEGAELPSAKPGPALARPSGVVFTRNQVDSGSVPIAAATNTHRRPIDLDVEMPGVLQVDVLPEVSEQEVALAESVASSPSEALVQALDGEDAEHEKAAFLELLNRGPDAFDALLEAFPGRLRVDRKRDGKSGPRTQLEAHSPVVYLCALQVLSLRERLRPLTRADNADRRYYAVRLLNQAADPEATDAMIGCLFDTDPQIRETALDHVETFLHMTDRSAVLRDIRRRFASDEPWVTEAAIRAVAQLIDTDAVDPLIRMLTHDSDHTRQRAAQALSKITFQDFGANQKAWERWAKKSGMESRIEWLLEAMVSKDWKVRDNASREIRNRPRLLVNYHPDLGRSALEAAARSVERHLRG